eukprot:3057685-Prymnesium_polylepis.1
MHAPPGEQVVPQKPRRGRSERTDRDLSVVRGSQPPHPATAEEARRRRWWRWRRRRRSRWRRQRS